MRILSLTAISVTALALAAPTAFAQTPAPYHAPRTSFGQPDLQGTYTTATITPLTRDPKLGTRNVLTKQEADALEQATRDQIARADALYEQGQRAIPLLRDGQRAMALAAALYREILRQIERDGFGRRKGRAVVPAWRTQEL
ncbi:MAG TPA: squalene/phytoene synthase family protein, partial [Phenylobacterium sp.]|uniref:squalene/phytoene synthase family protein n=1 Tax=Phenylobacterium sp. TaxID=1871053 RepID=UPI002CDBDA49